MNYSSDEVLNFLIETGKIESDDVLNELNLMKKNNILKQHPWKIFFSESDQRWHSYLPDDSKKNKRRPIARKKKEDIETVITNYYEHIGGIQVDRKDITLELLFKEWMIYRRDNTGTSPKTIEENAKDWKRFYQGTDLVKMPIREIKPVTITRFFRKVTKDRECTYKAISNARSLLNGMIYYAIEEELVSHNPVLDVNFRQFTYRAVNNSNDVFTTEEVAKLLEYLEPIREPYALAIQLAFYLFIRFGELSALRWDDIDMENKTIYLHLQCLGERQLNDDLSFTGIQSTISSQMKGHTSHGFRKEHLTPQAITILESARQLNPDGEYIFMPRGRLMYGDQFNRKLKAYCLACGVTYRSSHKIRFYNASRAYNGENLTTISKLMGHSQTATTLHYLRNVHAGQDQVAAFDNLGINSESNQN